MRATLRLKLTLGLLVSLAALPGALLMLLDSSAANDAAGWILAGISMAAFVSVIALFAWRIRPRANEFCENVGRRARVVCLTCGLAALAVALGILVDEPIAKLVLSGLALACELIVVWMVFASIPADL